MPLSKQHRNISSTTTTTTPTTTTPTAATTTTTAQSRIETGIFKMVKFQVNFNLAFFVGLATYFFFSLRQLSFQLDPFFFVYCPCGG